MSKKKKVTNKTAKELYLDRPTSHGGWPEGPSRGWIDKDPVNVQISNWLESMGLLDRPPHARLSESQLRRLIRKILVENDNYDS
jgi:hypothetical protein